MTPAARPSTTPARWPRASLVAILALPLALGACRSTAGAPTTSATATPPADAAAAAMPAPDAGSAPQGESAAGEVTLRMTNRAGSPRYIGYLRDWTEQLTLERHDGAKWAAVAYQPPLCAELCPADGSAPPCRFCSPPIPVPEAVALSVRDFLWDGSEYALRQPERSACSCQQAQRARAGRYRATLCTMAHVACEPAPCRPDPHGFLRRGVQLDAQPLCTSVEFELGREPLTVALDVVR